MGLLKHLLFWPVTGPSFLTRFSLEKVQESVHRELTDDERIREDLLALQMQLELEEVTEEEYVEREAELMRRLREVREWREELGMGTAGGPVRVSTRDAEAREGGAAGEAEPGEEQRGGLARPGGAEVRLDWEDDDAAR